MEEKKIQAMSGSFAEGTKAGVLKLSEYHESYKSLINKLLMAILSVSFNFKWV